MNGSFLELNYTFNVSSKKQFSLKNMNWVLYTILNYLLIYFVKYTKGISSYFLLSYFHLVFFFFFFFFLFGISSHLYYICKQFKFKFKFKKVKSLQKVKNLLDFSSNSILGLSWLDFYCLVANLRCVCH